MPVSAMINLAQESPIRASSRRSSWKPRSISSDRDPIAGVDEAGRGPLAGPVVAAAVILDPDKIPANIDDSKLLDEVRAPISTDAS